MIQSNDKLKYILRKPKNVNDVLHTSSVERGKRSKKNDNKLDYVLPYDVKRPTSITIPQTRGVGELIGRT
ncbi:hypothetical protein AAZX31_12G219200 [Glycine max]